jgi:hypothetical protein
MSNLLKCAKCGGEYRNTEGRPYKMCLDCRLETQPQPEQVTCVKYMSENEGARIYAGFKLICGVDT